MSKKYSSARFLVRTLSLPGFALHRNSFLPVRTLPFLTTHNTAILLKQRWYATRKKDKDNTKPDAKYLALAVEYASNTSGSVSILTDKFSSPVPAKEIERLISALQQSPEHEKLLEKFKHKAVTHMHRHKIEPNFQLCKFELC